MTGTLLYDADCGLCVATASWLAYRVSSRELRLLALSEAENDPDVSAAVRGRDLRASLHFVGADGHVLAGARAVLAAGRLVPRWRHLAIAFDRPLGHRLLEPLYRQVSRHRRRIGRLMRLPVACPIPSSFARPR